MSGRELTGFPHLCPDFVIELLSSSDRLAKTQAKMQEWIANGAQLGWLVDPYAKSVHVYARGRRSRIVAVLISLLIAATAPASPQSEPMLPQ